MAVGDGAASKKKKSATGSINVEDDDSADETDSNVSHFDSEDEGAVELNIPGYYDGGDGDNSEDEDTAAPSDVAEASSSSTAPASVADALVWSMRT